MENFTYAHNDTSSGERKTPTAKFNKVNLGEDIEGLRQDAFSRNIPTADDETLNFLTTLLSAFQPKNILELGTATGISGGVMLKNCKDAKLTTVEANEEFFREGVENFKKLEVFDRVRPILGDAGKIIEELDEKFDFIFLDCAKVQYIKYLPRLKTLLSDGGVLLADDVLLYGWLTGEVEIPKKRKMLAKHIEEFLQAVCSDSELATTILNVGDGLSLSVKRRI